METLESRWSILTPVSYGLGSHCIADLNEQLFEAVLFSQVFLLQASIWATALWCVRANPQNNMLYGCARPKYDYSFIMALSSNELKSFTRFNSPPPLAELTFCAMFRSENSSPVTSPFTFAVPPLWFSCCARPRWTANSISRSMLLRSSASWFSLSASY